MVKNIIFESLTTDIIKSESIWQGYLSINDNKNINNDLVNAIINNDNINIYVVYEDNSEDELSITRKEVDTESALKSFNYEFDSGYVRTDSITNVAFSISSDEAPVKFVFYIDTQDEVVVQPKSIPKLGGTRSTSDISKVKVNNATYNIKDATARASIELKQDTLVSGTNIKTVNNQSLLGSGNIAVQPPLVSGTNIKTINNNSLLGNGNIAINGAIIFNYNIDTYEEVSNKINSDSLMLVNDNSFTSYILGTGIRSDNAIVIDTLAYDYTNGNSDIRLCFCDYYITPNDVWERKIISNFSPINSPNFTGIPKAPTAATGTSTTQIATTAFVQNTVDTLSETYATITLQVFSAAGSQSVNLSGVTSNSHPVLDIVIPNNASSSSIKTMMDAWSHIYNAETIADAIVFYSDAATTTQLTIAVKGY